MLETLANVRREPELAAMSLAPAPALFTEGGKVGALMRAHDWTLSPLGTPEAWPHSLRTAVEIILSSRFPMFVAWGSDLVFLYNDAYADILGAKHPRAIGRPFSEIWSEIWPDISPLIDAALAGQATYRANLPLVMNRKGYAEQTWFTFSYSPLRDESGAVAGMFCAVAETTPQVVAEQALRESEGRLREMNETLGRRVEEALAQRGLLAEIVEATGAFVQVVDLEYRWLAFNQAAADEFERIFGVRPQVGASMLDLLADQHEHRAAVEAVWSRALGGEEFTAVEEFGSPARDRRAYEMRFNTLFGRGGERIGAYQFVYDVTERIQADERLRSAEAALRQAQKMEALGQLTGGVAHDFNNLLGVFANTLQVLELTGLPPTPYMMDAMRRAVTRGTGLTRQLLSFARRRPLHSQTLDVVGHLAAMRPMLETTLGPRVVIRTCVQDRPCMVDVDAGELELAVLNLCVNARDAMPEGGAITLTVDVTSLDLHGDGRSMPCVRLSVADTGVGMPPDVLARVFEPFFTTKDVHKGSGLGLPQVYGFAQQSAGRVTVDSTVGAGTCVTLLLPQGGGSRTACPGTGDVAPAPD